MIKKMSYSQDDLMEDLLLKNQTEADGKSIPGTINEIIDNINADPSPVKSVVNGNGMILDSSGKLMMNKSSTITAGAMSKEDKIKLDDLHNYELPIASTDTLGGVKVDGTSITINQNGVISSINQGKIYQNGDGIEVNNVNNTINAKIDNNTIKLNEQGQLYSEGGGEGKIYQNGDGIEVNNVNNTINAKIDNNTIKLNEQGQLMSMTSGKTYYSGPGVHVDNTTNIIAARIDDETLEIKDGDAISVKFDENVKVKDVENQNGLYLDSNGQVRMNVATHLTTGAMSYSDKTKLDDLHNYELPKASTDMLGGVKVDGSSITADQNGVISSHSEEKTYTGGTGIEVDNQNDKINAIVDDVTIGVNSDNQLQAEKYEINITSKSGGEGKTYAGGKGIEVDNQNDTINAIVDDVTIGVNSNNQLQAEKYEINITSKSGGEGKTYTGGDGIYIDNALNTISTKTDGTTIGYTEDGRIKVLNGGSVDIQAGTGIEIDKTTTPNTISASIGTNDSVGIVKADGITTFLDPDGTISSKATLPNINAGYGIKIEYGKGHDLPEEYTELLFIRGKAGCYLDTGVNADYTTAFEVTAQRLANPSEAFNVFGAAITGQTAGVQFLNNNNARCYSGSAATTYAATITGIYFDTLTFYSDIYKRTITNTVTGEVIQNDTVYPTQFDLKKNYYIGRINGAGVGADFTGRIYPILIWKDRNLVRYYVPAKKRDTQQIGLYDKVNNSFETSSTAAQFIEGPDVVPATTISTYDFTGATDTQAGYSGIVPMPLTSDKDKFLRGDGTWSDIPNITELQNEIENLKNEIENLKK